MKRLFLILAISALCSHVPIKSINLLERLDALREYLLWTPALDEVPNLDAAIDHYERHHSRKRLSQKLRSMQNRINTRLNERFLSDKMCKNLLNETVKMIEPELSK